MNYAKVAALRHELAGQSREFADATTDPFERFIRLWESFCYEPDRVVKARLAAAEADCVAAFQQQRRESGVLRFFKKCFYRFFNRVSNIELVPDASDFRVFKREVADALVSMPEYYRFSKGMFAWVGFNTVPYPYTPAPRAAGETKWSFGKLMRYGMDGVISFTTFPLKIASIVGSIAALIGVLMVIWVIVEFFMSSFTPSGYPTIVCLILIFGGMILGALGIIGEYVARIYMETKHRPMYIAKSVCELGDAGADAQAADAVAGVGEQTQNGCAPEGSRCDII